MLSTPGSGSMPLAGFPEKEMLSLIVKGKTDKEVVQALFISLTTEAPQ
ncbi:hypothetical protein [Parabacteroides sp. FAFU027]|nr:hypothetical protein [Parabacteroides sp. FAFU027]